jgi:hypothetical protein
MLIPQAVRIYGDQRLVIFTSQVCQYGGRAAAQHGHEPEPILETDLNG